MIEAGPVYILAAGVDLDLRHLADAARDSSADGRARLFALLAALMVSRWFSLKTGECQQLAELLAVLWPRGLAADHQRLADDLAAHPDVPAILRTLLTPLQQPAPQTNATDGAMVLKSAKSRPVTVTVRPMTPPSRLHQAAPRPDPVRPPGPHVPPASLSEPRTTPADDRFFDSVSSVPDNRPSATAPAPSLDMPRDNPHRLTDDLLTETLIQGDLPRFEAMLAQLTQLRTPLLRRLLEESGDEGFAILAHAAGVEQKAFPQQWRAWREQVAKLRPYAGLPNQRDKEGVAAFFAALTDPQVDRLIRRWRSDGDRLFRAGDN